MNKVMIVEDEVFISLVLQKTFERWGFEVLGVVRYGEEVLDTIEELGEVPDIMTMDIHLAGEQTGIQTTAQINEKYPDIPIIYCTAYSDEATRIEIEKTKYADVTFKPFQDLALREIVERVLGPIEV